MGIFFSIITPVYNSARLMGKLVKSLQNQSYMNFEWIIVDDCSTDDSYDKIKKLDNKLPFSVRIFQTQTNSGPGKARNIGLDNANGDYITFIDSDDWVESFFLESIYSIIQQYGYDCIVFDYYRVQQSKRFIMKSVYGIHDNKEIKKDEAIWRVRNHTIGKIYRRDRINTIRFPENLQRCEDVAFVARAITCCNTYYYSKPLYYYRMRKGSLSNNNELGPEGMVDAFKILENELQKDFPKALLEKSVHDLLYGGCLMLCKKKGTTYKEIKDYIYSYELKHPNWWESYHHYIYGKAKELFLILIHFHLYIPLCIMSRIHSLITQ